jgi:hypothetical protein
MVFDNKEMPVKRVFKLVLAISLLLSCSMADDDSVIPDGNLSDCISNYTIDLSRGACDQVLSFTSQYSEIVQGTNRIIFTNGIPNHMVGLFGKVQGSLNPNAIAEQSETYTITTEPKAANTLTPLLSTTGTGPNAGPQYAFGILLNGIELDPVAAEPFPHEGIMSPDLNWEWNLEAYNINLGLDCNNAHVQPTGKYHYHGSPTLFLENLAISNNQMTLIGYAADGFPIYYKYAHSTANDSNSALVEMQTSYRLKSGQRPGNGITAPCGTYDGIYGSDYEYVDGLGSLDEANGRTGVTPEYPQGTYYYIITDAYPFIPRYFMGTPSSDFKIGM